ncbi:unnamed protein product [Protopolystoma xenopodis]|uniref:Uncharacterized protein n=1 Tax=Protopolystoma xenopodis TaxID=117903 RepID=A0A448WFS0_9PLAT|nr:unnamed protein product [Protopolystoma xenopodis]
MTTYDGNLNVTSVKKIQHLFANMDSKLVELAENIKQRGRGGTHPLFKETGLEFTMPKFPIERKEMADHILELQTSMLKPQDHLSIDDGSMLDGFNGTQSDQFVLQNFSSGAFLPEFTSQSSSDSLSDKFRKLHSFSPIVSNGAFFCSDVNEASLKVILHHIYLLYYLICHAYIIVVDFFPADKTGN